MKPLYQFLCPMFHVISFCFFSILLSRCSSSDSPKQQPTDRMIHQVMPVIIRTLPHDTVAFTQGLLYHNGKLLESTGLRGQSSLRNIRLPDGSIQRKITIPDIFAEGIALKGNRLVQLTWQSNCALVYSYPDLKKIGMFSYEGEGWGLATEGKQYIMSNGSDTLYWRDKAFKVKRKIPVTLDGTFYIINNSQDTLQQGISAGIQKKDTVTLHNQPLKKLNELEYARGHIFANVLYNDFIFEIDPGNGEVIRIIDCGALVKQVAPLKEQSVLNGIAYNADSDTFFLTGKNWPLIFEVTIPEL